jgi:GTP-binding protein
MFIDEKELTIEAGKGGDGAALFRREKYVPFGGPDGGDGGRGGDVSIEGRSNLHALTHLAYANKIIAQNGAGGGHQRSSGISGESELITVPLGTIIFQKQEDGTWKEIGEISVEGEQKRLVKGGNGGWGNWHFKSSIQQAPKRFNPGQAGEKMEIKLVLKLIADIGLVGLPNAGKSTFLSVVSAARPKIADYPFTTLEPQLGVAQWGKGKEQQTLVIADLPGLIEGASQGKGLGAQFLKHIERTHAIIHCLEASATVEELIERYDRIRNELSTWSPVLAEKDEKIALTKIDLISEEELVDKVKALKKHTKKEIFPLSAVAHKGLDTLLTACAKASIVTT